MRSESSVEKEQEKWKSAAEFNWEGAITFLVGIGFLHVCLVQWVSAIINTTAQTSQALVTSDSAV
jgi:hypothetical protein